MYIYKCVRIYKILLPFFFRLLIPYFGVALKFPSTFSFHFSRLFHSFFFFFVVEQQLRDQSHSCVVVSLQRT